MRSYYPHSVTLQEFAEYWSLPIWQVAGFCCPGDENLLSAGGCKCGKNGHWSESLRRLVSRAIYEAENEISRFAGFYPKPRYFEDVPVRYPGSPIWQDRGGRHKRVFLPNRYGYVSNFGVQTLTYIGEFAVNAVPATDEYQIFTISVTGLPANTAEGELVVYYRASDRATTLSSNWEIPIIQVLNLDNVTHTADIDIYAYNLGKPAPADCLDMSDTADYVSHVDVYRRVIDPAQAGIVTGYSAKCPRSLPPDFSHTLYIEIANNTMGMIVPYPATYNAGVWTRDDCALIAPVSLVLNFMAGYPLDSGAVNPLMLEAVANLAASKLSCDFPDCNCSDCIYDQVKAAREIARVKTAEGSELGGVGDAYALLVTKEEIQNCPFYPPVNGALKAWKILADFRIL